MLAIRLQRIGKKNRPSYRVVVSEHRRDLAGRHNEILGNYDPVANPKTVNLKADRIKYWISVGAKPSATVHNLLVKQGVIEGAKVRAWKPKKKAEEAKAAGTAPKTEAPKTETPKEPEAPAPEAKTEEKSAA
ncbi:MAG: 30S ribosomal protein S16 [Patescibacteria group bacterium]|mgnify:FL=1